MNTGIVREFGAGTSRARHGFIMSGGLTALGLWILFLAGDSVPDRQLAGLLTLGLGIGISVYVWRKSRNTGVLLRIDAEGVWYRDWGLTVPWRQIDGVHHTGHRFQPYVSIRVRDPAALFGALPENQVGRLQSDRLWKSPHLRIPNGAVEVAQTELLEILRGALKEHA
jgi:hypothetical protein